MRKAQSSTSAFGENPWDYKKKACLEAGLCGFLFSADVLQLFQEKQVMDMKTKKVSLQMGLLMTILSCWLVPIVIVVTLAGILLNRSYMDSIQQQTDASAENALRLVQMQVEDAVKDSKAVSYDGVVRAAYRGYLQSGDSAALYGEVNNYLSQNFTREEMYRAVFVQFWNVDTGAYVLTQGTTSYELLRQCQEHAPQILAEMADADTDIRILLAEDHLYMARNLLDTAFTPYATVVMLLDPAELFRPLNAVSRVAQVQYSIDGYRYLYNDAGELANSEGPWQEYEVRYDAEAEGHTITFTAMLEEYGLWADNQWLRWAVAAVALMALPMLLFIIRQFYRHVTRPMETLAQANQLVQSGQRGYEITQTPPNMEFGKLYDHFNAMSAELQMQFQRSFLEQQATQQAKIKALQSQINPHFLNNTLEIINWEARFAENDRVSAMIEALSTMLDAALDRDGRTQIALSEELVYVDAYLYIIHERLGEGFRVHKQISPDVLEQKIPRLILQPIVENAVEHDITARRGGDLWVRAYRRDQEMVLEVEHDGTMTEADRENIRKLLTLPGAETETAKVGLRNVNQRLSLIYGDKGSLTVEEVQPGAVLARITFPL